MPFGARGGGPPVRHGAFLMAGIPDETVQEVRDRVDIVDLVGRYVELRRAGKNFKGLCPFHSERTASFNVNPARKGYKCFGCGAGGDAIRFVMEVEGHSFPEAIRKLADMYGVHLPAAASRSVREDSSRSERDEAYAIMRTATELYRDILLEQPEGQAGRDYVAERGLTDEVSESFLLGYAPAPAEAGWDRLTTALDKAGHDMNLAETLGLVAKSERGGSGYDRFRGRLMFPVVQPGGEVIAFSGRVVPPHDEPEPGKDDRPIPKYTNSPEHLLFRKSKALFGLAQSRRAMHAKRRALLVEGNVDVVKLHQWELGEAIAPLGTALTEDQAKLLARFTDQVIMCFDGDAAGKKAAWKALPILLAQDLDVRMVLLPEGEDPDSLGRERLVALLDAAGPALVEMIVRIAARAGTAVDARAQGLDRVIPLIAMVPRETARDLYADRAAELFSVPRDRVTASIRNHRNRDRNRDRSRDRSRDRNRDRSRDQQRSRGPSEDRDQDRSHMDRRQPHPDDGQSRDFHSKSEPPVQVSAAVANAEPLPEGQAMLAMLLVDLPHLASVARRQGVLDCVRDPRLAPIANAVVEGAEAGREPTLDELLGLVDAVDAGSVQQVHDAVFEGRFRTEDGQPAADLGDPKALLDELVHRCQEERLEVEIAELDRDFARARAGGDVDAQRELQMRKLDLRRRQEALRHGRPPAAADSAPTLSP